MKLNPPASSSDLEAARQIARRLHQTRRRDDRAAAAVEDVPLPRPRLTPPPVPPADPEPAARAPRLEARPPAPAPRPVPAPLPEPEDPVSDDVDVDVDVEVPAPAPAWRAPGDVPAPTPAWREPEPSLDQPEPIEDLASEPSEPAFAPAGEPAFDEAEAPDLDAPALSPDELVGDAGADADASPLDSLTEPEPSPFDEALLDAPPVAEEPAPPSWDDIVETCRGMAQARGAMLVDPAGQVFSARGDWPAPGPDAIAGKLVTMMAKALKDAPTRSISAPLMGMHLTAWRVPLSEGLMTVAFIGTAAVRADARPAIDAEIASGAR